MWDFGTHPSSHYDGNGGFMMMSQAPKYLWIDVSDYWGYVIFSHVYNIFSDYEGSWMQNRKICYNVVYQG